MHGICQTDQAKIILGEIVPLLAAGGVIDLIHT
jgi:hypothetical protein